MKRACLLLIAASLLATMAWPTPVQAAKRDVGLKITPLRKYPVLNPGATTADSITVTNSTSKTQTISLSAEVFGVINEAYDYNFQPSETAQWIQFADKRITLVSHQSRSVAYSLAVPANATPGGHFFALLASTTPPIKPGQVNEVSRVASLIYLQVNGQINQQSRLLSASVPWFTGSPTIPLVTQVADSGNTYIRARAGVYATREPFGRPANLAQLNSVILPSTVRKISGTVKLSGVPGLYKVDVQYASPSGTPTVISHYVLYLPVWLQLAAAALVVGGAWRLWLYRRRSHSV